MLRDLEIRTFAQWINKSSRWTVKKLNETLATFGIRPEHHHELYVKQVCDDFNTRLDDEQESTDSDPQDSADLSAPPCKIDVTPQSLSDIQALKDTIEKIDELMLLEDTENRERLMKRRNELQDRLSSYEELKGTDIT